MKIFFALTFFCISLSSSFCQRLRDKIVCCGVSMVAPIEWEINRCDSSQLIISHNTSNILIQNNGAQNEEIYSIAENWMMKIRSEHNDVFFTKLVPDTINKRSVSKVSYAYKINEKTRLGMLFVTKYEGITFIIQSEKSPSTGFDTINNILGSLNLFTPQITDNSSAKTTLYSYKIGTLATIDIPSSMELRDSSMIEKVDSFKKNFSSYKQISIPDGAPIVFQPVGLNDGRCSDKYARIIINVKQGNKGDYFLKTLTKQDFSSEDISSITTNSKNTLEKELIKLKCKLLEWDGLTIDNNNCFSLKICYSRQCLDSPIYNTVIKFPNDYYEIEITYSYKEDEEYYWKSDFEESLKSFRWSN